MSKLLCVDLDGTLLDDDKNVSSGDKAAILEALENGHKFAIVTGRPLASALKVAKESGLMIEGSYIATFNGGQVYDCSKGEIISEVRMPIEYAEYVFKKAKEAGLHVHTYKDEYVVCDRESDELKFYLKNTKLESIIDDNPLGVLDKNPIKLIVMSLNGREVLEPFRDSLKEWCEGKLSSIFSNPCLLEYSSPDIGKGNAIRQLSKLLSVDICDVIACGDEENDISMIEAAGVGVAMKNATDPVKAVADYITEKTNNEQGIKEVIDRFILPN